VKLVVDASVVVPCFVPERFSSDARRWLGSRRELDHPVYACAYVALAEAEDAGLLTADRKLVQLIVASRLTVQAHWVARKLPRIH